METYSKGAPPQLNKKFDERGETAIGNSAAGGAGFLMLAWCWWVLRMLSSCLFFCDDSAGRLSLTFVVKDVKRRTVVNKPTVNTSQQPETIINPRWYHHDGRRKPPQRKAACAHHHFAATTTQRRKGETPTTDDGQTRQKNNNHTKKCMLEREVLNGGVNPLVVSEKKFLANSAAYKIGPAKGFFVFFNLYSCFH